MREVGETHGGGDSVLVIPWLPPPAEQGEPHVLEPMTTSRRLFGKILLVLC